MKTRILRAAPIVFAVSLLRFDVVASSATREVPPPPFVVPRRPLAPAQPASSDLSLLTREQVRALTPTVELWRAGARRGQAPARHGRFVDRAFVTGNQPVMVRLQFDRSASGKSVIVHAGTGVTIEPPNQALQIRPTGEVVFNVRLDERIRTSRVTLWCQGLTTMLPLSRVPAGVVAASENVGEGGGR